MKYAMVLGLNRGAGLMVTLLAMVLGANDATASGAPGLDELQSLTYVGIYDKPITLKNGMYEGKPFVSGGASRPRVQLIEDLYRLGDLNDEGVNEAAVLLVESSGGSGTDTYLAVVGRRAAHLSNIGTVWIGDRVQILSFTMQQGEIALEIVTTGSDEPACCPTLKVRKSYRLQGEKLIEAKSDPLGHLSLADLQGHTWKLTQFASNEPVPEGIDVTAVFQPDKVSGSAGCNRYFAGLNASSPNTLTLSDVGSSRMACPAPDMEVETRYLSLLQKVKQFSFLLGKLALTYQDGDIWETMVFE